MATAQQMPAGPRSARLADDAATAALYATQPRRKVSVREPASTESQHSNQRGTRGASDLSAASAGAALAHANRKPVEVWRPGRLTDAEKAAWCMKDYKAPEFPQPSTQYSAAGLGAAILAVRDHKGTTSTQTSHTQDVTTEQSEAVQDKALLAATGAFTTRKRSDSAPTEPAFATDSPWARSAAGASRRVREEEESPLGHLDSAMEASRIRHVANTNAKLYTSAPPVASEVEERNRRNSLHAAALSMAKNMYDITGPTGETSDASVYAAQRGQDRARFRHTIGGGEARERALTLQDAAQRRAAEKLARMQDEHAELQQYYGTAPQPQRSRLAVRRKRTSSEADVTKADAEQSRHIRDQMFSLRTKLDKVDEKRQQDRDLLMEAARRNVDATMKDLEMKLYHDTGRAPPSIQKQWDEAAQARACQEAETAEVTGARRDRVNIGGEQYVDMAEVEAVARSRVQPALDEIADQAEQQRARETEARLDAEEQQRQAEIEKEREADMKAAPDKEEKVSRKREFKGLGFGLLLWRRKSKRVPAGKAEPETEEPAQKAAAVEPPIQEEPVPKEGEAPAEAPTQAAAVVTTDEAPTQAAAVVTTDEAPTQAAAVVTTDEAPTQAAAVVATDKAPTEAAAVVATEAPAPQPSAPEVREAVAVATVAPAMDVTAQRPVEEPETPGATAVYAAAPAPLAAPVKLVQEPTEPGQTSELGAPRHENTQRDAAATAGTVSAMHTVKPITSPRADSKLKTWFRDRLGRRSSTPVAVYPNQPGPEYSTDSEVGFTGGAALTGANEPRGAALTSHPVTGADLETQPSIQNDKTAEAAQTVNEASAKSNGTGKKKHFRRSFLKTVSRVSPERKTNGVTSQQNADAIPEAKETGTDLEDLRKTAAEQGLTPPAAVNPARESRFSEDL